MPAPSAPSAAAQTVAAARRTRPSFDETTSFLEGRAGVRLRSLVQIRWIAVAGQAVTAGAVHWGLGFRLPVLFVFGTIGMSALLNLIFELGRPTSAQLRDREAAVFLGFDVLQLTLLLYLTGGISNPFVLLLLAPVAVAGSNLSRGSVTVLTGLSVLCTGLVTLFHLPLPWDGAAGPAVDLRHRGLAGGDAVGRADRALQWLADEPAHARCAGRRGGDPGA